MLVLSRFVNQQIQIGDDITITICGLSSNKVRVGIEAPRELAINRPDALLQVQEQDLQDVLREAIDGRR